MLPVRTRVACNLGVDLGADPALHLFQKERAQVDQRLVDLACRPVAVCQHAALVKVLGLFYGNLRAGRPTSQKGLF
jgi:hypothetical protein